MERCRHIESSRSLLVGLCVVPVLQDVLAQQLSPAAPAGGGLNEEVSSPGSACSFPAVSSAVPRRCTMYNHCSPVMLRPLHKTHACPHNHIHKHTQNYPCLAQFIYMLDSKLETWKLPICLVICLSIYLSKWSWIQCLSWMCWSNTVYFRCSHNSCLLNDSSYLSIQTFWTFTPWTTKSLNLERKTKSKWVIWFQWLLVWICEAVWQKQPWQMRCC